jgi:hypothetical protein
VLRGLVRDGVPVAAGAKLAEVDPRGDPALCFGLGERPRRIAEAVAALLAGGPVALAGDPDRDVGKGTRGSG